VTVAAMVNLFVFLRSNGSDAASSAWAGVAAILAATLMAVMITWRFSNYLYSFSIAWALSAIAIRQSGNTAIVVACAAGVVISLVMAMSFVLSLPTLTPKLRENE
jgi:hypothetical protein